MASILRKAKISTYGASLTIRGLSTMNSRHVHTKPLINQQVAAAVTKDPALDLSTAKPISEIPGPRIFPIVGSLPAMLLDKAYDIKRIHIFWNKLLDIYGPIVKFAIPGFGTMIAMSNPDDCETFSRITMEYPERPPLMSIKKIRLDATEYYDNKTGILLENGEEWKRVRSRVQTPMMKPKNVYAYVEKMDQVALDFMERIVAFQKEYGEMPSTFHTELHKWALESVALVALNRRLGCLEANLPQDSEAMTLIKETNSMFENIAKCEFGPPFWRIKFLPSPTYNKLRKSHSEFLRVADQNIRQTEAQLLAKDPNSDEDLTLMETLLLTPGLSRTDVVTLILDMLVAGIETTSNALGFTLYLLARNPRVQRKLQDEVDSVIGNHSGPITAIHLGKMSYLKCVVKESLRVLPLAIGSARVLQKDAVLGGYHMPKGVIVMTLNYHMLQNEEYFPRAKEFLPERWARDRPYGAIHPFTHMPFGFGTRMCIGRRIAEQELYTFLIRAMQRFNVDYKYKDMDVINRLFLMPADPLRFSFTERLKE
ncbi:hypothetical protein SK128_017315 [Halocaridina rubra]|uniref:Cytochrome P450 n=1 Tax=Halocaridina rubra TaxID=373956 RepID=A0AAN8X122_HALRR